MKLYAQVGHKLERIPDPKPGFGFLLVPARNELIDRVNSGTNRGKGHWAEELVTHLEKATEEFFRTRPIDIHVPSRSEQRGLTLYDSRDPLRHPINR